MIVANLINTTAPAKNCVMATFAASSEWKLVDVVADYYKLNNRHEWQVNEVRACRDLVKLVVLITQWTDGEELLQLCRVQV